MIRPETIKPCFDCHKCGLRKTATRPVWGRGPEKPLFILVGQSPGHIEDETGIPFNPDAPAGELITDILKEIGVKRSEIYITNAVRCFEGFRGKIGTEHIKACRPYLMDELSKLKCDTVVLAGNEAMKSMLGHVGITKEHGRLRVGPNGLKFFPIFHPASALQARTPENRNRIRDALKALVDKLRGVADPLAKFYCKIVKNRELLDELEHRLKSLPDDTLVIQDYETNTVLSPFHIPLDQYVVSGCSFVWEETGGYYLPIDHQNPANVLTGRDYDRAKSLIRWYALSKLRKGNQNIKYDYLVTRGYFGVRYRRIYTDPMLESHLLNPKPGTHGLDKLAWFVGMGGYDSALEQWFIDNKIPDKKRNYTLVPLNILGRYAIGDGICALKYHNKFFPEVCKRGQRVFYINRVMGAVIAYADMEAKGMLLDRPYLKKLDIYYKDKHKEMRIQLRKLVRSVYHLDHGANLDSPEQMAKLLHSWLKLESIRKRQVAKLKANDGRRSRDRNTVSKDPADYVRFNASGLVSTDKTSLKGILAFVNLSKEQREFLNLFREYRAGRTRYNRNVKGMKRFICYDGRVRSNLLMHGTGTSRRSSQKPNLQNIPRDAIVKRAFIAAEGCLLPLGDYKNLEVRIAAAKSGDKALLAAFNSGKDVHSYLGSKAYDVDYDMMVGVLGMPWDEVRKDEKLLKAYQKYSNYRARAKVIWWVLLFGGGPDKIADGAGISFNEAARLQRVVYSEFPRLRDMFDKFADFADEHSYARTDFGRRRYLDGITSSNDSMYFEARRQALNTPIQGTAADITLRAVTLLRRRWRKLKLKAENVQEVHDSVAVETPYREIYTVLVNMKRTMESITCPAAKGKIVFEIDLSVGTHLGSKLKVDKNVLHMAKTAPKELYELCRKDLEHEPAYYAS